MNGAQDNVRLYLARFEKLLATVYIDQGQLDVFFNGHVLVAGFFTDEKFYISDVYRLAAWSDDLLDLGGFLDFTGPLSHTEPPVTDPEGAFDASMYYPLLGKQTTVLEEFDAVFPPLETLRGQLTLVIFEATEKSLRGSLSLTMTGDPDNLLGTVRSVLLEKVELVFQPLIGAGDDKVHHSLAACVGLPPVGLVEANFNLTLRFINLSTVPGNNPAAGAASHPLESVVQTQINGACEVWWLRAGIKFTPYHVVGQLDIAEPPTNKKLNGIPPVNQQSTLPSDVGFTVNNAIEVYLVDQLLGTAVDPAGGGGIAFNCGTRDAFVVLEIGKAQNNPYLLAHELGHVLRLAHPDEVLAGTAYIAHGSECSVMVPDNPMSDRNTLNNISNARSSLPLDNVLGLGPGIGTCSFNPSPIESYFHIVRDFPLDDGEEPSVPRPPAQFWWTHSDVWNSNKLPRLTAAGKYDDNTDMFNPDYSPVHSEPSRLHTNQMYVRLHTCNQLTNDVNVYLLLAVPGVALEPLTLIQPTSSVEHNPIVFSPTPYAPFTNSGLPLLGSPRYQKIAWNVPAGYPTNCCVFAAAVTAHPNEDDPGLAAIVTDPAHHHFQDLFVRLSTDNDVAQRNLHIQNVLPWPFHLLTTLDWLQFANPLERAGQANLIIDGRQAAELSDLKLVGENGERWPVEGWRKERRSLKLTSSLKPGNKFAFWLQANIPPNLPMVSEFPIHLSFQIDNTLVGGFTYVIQVSTLERVASQVLDNLYGAIFDASITLHSDLLREMAGQVHFESLQFGSNPERALDWLGSLAGLVADRAASLDTTAGFLELHATHRLEAHQMVELLLQLAAILSISRNMAKPVWLEKVRHLANRLQCIAGRLVRDS